jgi:hypothetical protein
MYGKTVRVGIDRIFLERDREGASDQAAGAVETKVKIKEKEKRRKAKKSEEKRRKTKKKGGKRKEKERDGNTALPSPRYRCLLSWFYFLEFR